MCCTVKGDFFLSIKKMHIGTHRQDLQWHLNILFWMYKDVQFLCFLHIFLHSYSEECIQISINNAFANPIKTHNKEFKCLHFLTAPKKLRIFFIKEYWKGKNALPTWSWQIFSLTTNIVNNAGISCLSVLHSIIVFLVFRPDLH